MSVTLEGRAPYERVLAYERVRDETGREMHKSTGNAIEANEAIERMGADVMRWMYCEQVPSQNLNFGYGPAHEIKRRLLTLWNSVKFFVDYANVSLAPGEAGELDPLDRWLLSRVEQLVADATDAYERYWTPDVISSFEAFVDDLSNWYIRRSRRRFWNGDVGALETLLDGARPRARRDRAGDAVPRRAPLAGLCGRRDQPESVFLVRWQEAGERDEELLAEVAETRRVVELGRQARATSGFKLRQPLRRLVVEGAPLAEKHVDEIRDELRVKEVEFGSVDASQLRVKPNLPVLGPKLGKELGAVRAALEAGEFEELADGGFRVAGHDLGADEVLVERIGKEGWAVAGGDGVTVALDTALDAELEVEGRVLDLIHELNSMRKEAGLELTDRIVVTLPESASDLLAHEDWIKEEVLAVEIRTDGGSASRRSRRHEALRVGPRG